MLLFQFPNVHLWRIGLILFLSALPSTLGRSDPSPVALRITQDSPLTPFLTPEVTPIARESAPESTSSNRETGNKISFRQKNRNAFTVSLTPGATPPRNAWIRTASADKELGSTDEGSSAFFLQNLLSRYQENSGNFAKLPQRERAALHAFYDMNQYELLWTSPQGWTGQAQQLITTLRDASREGLKPSDYNVPSLSPGASLEDMAKAEIGLSAALVSYARDARGARFNTMGISRHLASPVLALPSVEEVLSKLHNSGDGPQILADYNPTAIPLYRQLRQALANVRSTTQKRQEPSCVSSPKDKKKCIPQKVNKASARTRAEGKILANMERLRWLPPHLGTFYVMVNVPTFNASIISQDQQVLASRVVIGKLATRTPLLSSQISSIIVNPTWYVPASIAREITHRRGYRMRQSKHGLLLTQPPGERNALGRLKLIFSSPYGIYMHDTPVRHLFSAPTRAFSHGCIRLDDPIHFAASLLAHSTSSSEEKAYKRLSQLIGTKRESSVAFPHHVPIYVTYITVRMDGPDVVLLGDIYGYDGIMIPRLLS